MKKRLAILALLVSPIQIVRGGALTAYRTESGQTITALPQVLVRYKFGQGAGVAKIKTMTSIGVHVVPVPKGQTLQSFVDQLKKDPNVEFAEPNGVYRAFTAPNDPDYSSQYSLQSNYIQVEGAWDITLGVSSVTVAVIDTGITTTHQDLSANLWVNPSPSGNAGLNGTRIQIDWNGDGDCLDTDVDLGPEQCASSDPTDDNIPEFHGTRVSGIIAATTNNGLNMAGVARGCRVMGIKALSADGVGSFDAIAEGIVFAVDHGASVINMSLGGSTGSDAVVAAVNYAVTNNVVLVAAAGNSGNSAAVNFPAAISKVIAVGATDSTNTLAYFSCTGNALDLVAPGVGILSTIPPNTTSAAGGDGTSFSSPIVAGVAALIRSIDSTFTIDEVTRYIDFTATDLGVSGFDTGYGFGLLNASLALQSANARTVFVSNPAQPGDTFAYPNPFRPVTGEIITISLPSSLGSQDLEIDILNVAGERVKTLTGVNSWDGKNESGNTVASGLYFYFAKTSKGDAKGKLSVIK